ncbi:MAG: hypothetical protein M1333_01800 [Patescibacteria group bacterium]|nr:hypothetical protein [Patescibacteria group bacterium]
MNRTRPRYETLTGDMPFLLGEKVGEGEHAEVFRSLQDPHKLVKKLKIREEFTIWDDFDAEHVLGNYSEEQFREHYQSALSLLQKHLEGFLPKTQLVFGHTNENKTTGYLITEEVMPETTDNSKEKLEKMDEMLAAVVQMFIDQPKGPKFVPDIFGKEEFRYGHTANNLAPKFYILDVYPTFKMTSSELCAGINQIIQKDGQQFFPKTLETMKQLEYM